MREGEIRVVLLLSVGDMLRRLPASSELYAYLS